MTAPSLLFDTHLVVLRGILISLLAAGVVCPLGAAGEGTVYFPGDTVSVKGTTVSCAVAATSVTCSKQGGLSAKLDTKGRVQVTKGSTTLFARSASSASGHHILDTNGSFAADTFLFCHVYIQGGRTTSCYEEPTPQGGEKGSFGFDMSNARVDVFRFPQTGVFQTTKTFAQP